ncbi:MULTISPECIES: transposase [unclassified Nocardiopsis]|uniref:transposase n=1 Tax=Nocardiopsis TaxID=2013 RepID=UPI00387B4EC0
MNTVQTEETPRNQRFWQRILIRRGPGTSPGTQVGTPRSARATVAIAAVPSAASLVWTAWSLIDMIPAPLPVGLAAGVVLDIALVSAVAIAWIAPQVAKPAKITGWLIAAVAALLVGYHAYTILPALAALGIIPLFAKSLWHLALNARLARAAAEAAQAEADRAAAAEKAQRDAELSTDPTHEQKRSVAEKLQQAAHEEEMADAEVRLADAQAEREHRLRLAKIRRDAKEQREMEREDAATVKQRMELIREIRAAQPVQFALGSGEVPDDLSSLPRSPGTEAVMGFGAVMGSDLGASRGRPVGDQPVIDPQVRELLAYIAEAGEGASVRGAARRLEVSAPTIRRWRDKAEAAGLDVSALKPTK